MHVAKNETFPCYPNMVFLNITKVARFNILLSTHCSQYIYSSVSDYPLNPIFSFRNKLGENLIFPEFLFIHIWRHPRISSFRNIVCNNPSS